MVTLCGVGWQHPHKHTNTKKHLRPFCYCSEIFKLLVYYCVVIVSAKHDWTNLVTDQLLTDLFIAWPCSLVALCKSPNKTQMFLVQPSMRETFFCHTRKQFVWCSGAPHSAFSPRKDCRWLWGASAVGNDCMLLTVKQASDLQSKIQSQQHIYF